MTKNDLETVQSYLKRTNDLPDILHLRAAPYDYQHTQKDKDLLLKTYEELDNILKEVAAFINVKFPDRKDYIQAWNDIDFDTKIGGIKIVTTNREHKKADWKEGLFDLQSLIKSLIHEVNLLYKEAVRLNPLLDEKEWDNYLEKILEKRADHADYFLDMIIEKKLINLDKPTLRKYFKQWFKNSQTFTLRFKDGDLAIEDGDIQIAPDFSEKNIPDFLKWFETKGNDFLNYLKEQGVNVKQKSRETIINNGNLIINKKSKIEKQAIENHSALKESKWFKAKVLIALIVGVATITGVIWTIYSS